MIKIWIAVVAAAGMLSTTVAQDAGGLDKEALERARFEVKANADGERRSCSRLAGNARAVCIDRVRGEERIALAQLQLSHTGAADDEFAFYQAQYEARYEVEKQRCADQSGKEKDICVQQARTERDKAKADARMARRINEAVAEDTRARLKADYELAREKCDLLSGDPRGVCIQSARERLREGW